VREGLGERRATEDTNSMSDLTTNEIASFVALALLLALILFLLLR